MDESIRRIGQAKATIDNGMCRVGPRLERSAKTDALLTGHASRAVNLADAVVQLCRHDHASEALPVLRYLMETAVAMRWVVGSPEGESADRAVSVLEELEKGRWEDLWPSGRLEERMRAAGMEEEAVSAISVLCRAFTQGGRSILPWSHVFQENQRGGADAETVLRLTVRMIAHVMKALDARWPGSFPGSEALGE